MTFTVRDQIGALVFGAVVGGALALYFRAKVEAAVAYVKSKFARKPK